jgi:lipoprotein-anchoring transpeptidase ErfK/SrfK
MTLSRRKAISLLSIGGLASLTIGASSARAAKTRYNFTADRWAGRARYAGKKTIAYKSSHKPGTIIVSTGERKLYFILAGGKAIQYGVGVGRQGFEWSGSAKIARKAEWPSWRPPKEMIIRERKKYGRELPAFVDGGPNNPLGARALYLYQGGRDTLYRIHGTNAPQTIGLALSSGCIRMLNEEVIDLYRRVRIGARVIVT